MPVSKRSSMRTTPFPSAEPRLPRMRRPPCVVLVIRCSFVRVCHGLPRCAGHRAAAPTMTGTDRASHRSRPAPRDEGRRPVAAPPGEPRRAPPRAARVDAATPLGGRSGGAQPGRRRSPDLRPVLRAGCACSRPQLLAAPPPRELTYLTGYVTVKLRTEGLARQRHLAEPGGMVEIEAA